MRVFFLALLVMSALLLQGAPASAEKDVRPSAFFEGLRAKACLTLSVDFQF